MLMKRAVIIEKLRKLSPIQFKFPITNNHFIKIFFNNDFEECIFTVNLEY